MTDFDRKNLKKVLKKNFLFEALTQKHIDSLSAEVWLEPAQAEEIIVKEGDQADTLYIVVMGGVNIVKADGQFLAFLGPGGFFGEMSLFQEGSRRTATCKAAGDTLCAIIRKNSLEKYCTQYPEAGLIIYRAIIKTLSERLQATSADLAMLMKAQVKKQDDISQLVKKAKAKTNTKK